MGVILQHISFSCYDPGGNTGKSSNTLCANNNFLMSNRLFKAELKRLEFGLEFHRPKS